MNREYLPKIPNAWEPKGIDGKRLRYTFINAYFVYLSKLNNLYHLRYVTTAKYYMYRICG